MFLRDEIKRKSIVENLERAQWNSINAYTRNEASRTFVESFWSLITCTTRKRSPRGIASRDNAGVVDEQMKGNERGSGPDKASREARGDLMRRYFVS